MHQAQLVGYNGMTMLNSFLVFAFGTSCSGILALNKGAYINIKNNGFTI